MAQNTSPLIDRDIEPGVREAAGNWPAVSITGPRQSGKTTLCKKVFHAHTYVTLEDPDTRAFAQEDPRGFLAGFTDGAILDEIQRVPELVSYLQGIVDRNPDPGRWILTGSHNLKLSHLISQSLVGRITEFQLLPLSWNEVQRFPDHPRDLNSVLFTGSYPSVFQQSLAVPDWYKAYVGNYVERDVRDLLNVRNQSSFERFVQLCAGRVAQLLNFQSLANDVGIAQPTVRDWVSVLEASYVLFKLPPEDRQHLNKRLTKSPKLHFFDSGLVCWLLGIRTVDQLHSHPLRGSIFETWVVSEVLKQQVNSGNSLHDMHFYRDQNGKEADLIVQYGDKTTILEAKASETPSPGTLKVPNSIMRLYQQRDVEVEAFVVFGGTIAPGSDKFISWRNIHNIEFRKVRNQVSIRCNEQPVSGARVIAFFANETWKEGTTDDQGNVKFELYRTDQPMHLMVAAEGYGACEIPRWVPDEGNLNVELPRLPAGGSNIYTTNWISLSTLSGTFNPKKIVGKGNLIAYTNNLALNGQSEQPTHIEFKKEIKMEDSDGHALYVKIVNIKARITLIQYTENPS